MNDDYKISVKKHRGKENGLPHLSLQTVLINEHDDDNDDDADSLVTGMRMHLENGRVFFLLTLIDDQFHSICFEIKIYFTRIHVKSLTIQWPCVSYGL